MQKQGDVLTIVGLSPVSGPGFVLVLQDGRVTLTNQSGMEVPFPPRFVVLDVQRVFFPWGSCDGANDGEATWETPGERIARCGPVAASSNGASRGSTASPKVRSPCATNGEMSGPTAARRHARCWTTRGSATGS